MRLFTHVKVFVVVYLGLVLAVIVTDLPTWFTSLVMWCTPVVALLGAVGLVHTLVVRRREQLNVVSVADLSRRELRRMRRQGRIG